MKKKGLKIISRLCVLCVVALATSCQTQKGWVYKPNRWGNVEKVEQKMTIPAFEDFREGENKNKLLLYYVPLIPYGSQKLTTPELIPTHLNSGMWINFDPKVDFAKALVKEVQNGTPFKNAVYSESAVTDGYYIQGRILNMDYSSKMYSYCLSYLGACFWFFGFPAGTFTNDLSIELTCYAPESKVIFQKTYKVDTYKQTTWIYNLKSDFEYNVLLKDIYSDFIREFNAVLQRSGL